jgi:hypothetical protein
LRPAANAPRDVSTDLFGPRPVFEQRRVAEREYLAAGEPVGGVIDDQVGAVNKHAAIEIVRPLTEPVPDRSALHDHDLFETVRALWYRREPQPPAGLDLPESSLDRGCRDVVALVDDDEPVAVQQLAAVQASRGLAPAPDSGTVA